MSSVPSWVVSSPWGWPTCCVVGAAACPARVPHREHCSPRPGGPTRRDRRGRLCELSQAEKRWDCRTRGGKFATRTIVGLRPSMPARNQPKQTLPGRRRREFNGLTDWDRAQSPKGGAHVSLACVLG